VTSAQALPLAAGAGVQIEWVRRNATGIVERFTARKPVSPTRNPADRLRAAWRGDTATLVTKETPRVSTMSLSRWLLSGTQTMTTRVRRRFVLVGAAAALAVVAAGCSDAQVGRTDERAAELGYIEGPGAVTFIPPDEREPAPEFGGPLLGEDGEFWLADAAGEVVVLNVWGSWCPPCRKEAPALQAVYEDVRDEGVQFVGINIRDNTTDALRYEEEFGITYPSVVDTDGRRMLAFRDTLPPNAIPTTLIIDRDGRMAARVLGEITELTLREVLDDVLAEETG
jgi:thiol-disulfide isomerase/thioredoxin